MKPYSHGLIHVAAVECPTCVFRPGNQMRLRRGRLAGMIRAAREDQSAIICHSTTHGQSAQETVCRGFYDRYATLPLRLARVLGIIRFVDAPDA